MKKKEIGFIIVGIIAIIFIVKLFFIQKTDKISEDQKIKGNNTQKNDLIKKIRVIYDTSPFKKVRAVPILNNSYIRNKISYQYDWSLNSENIQNNKFTLRNDDFKKGDKIYCVITPKIEGKLYKPSKANFVIPNSSPVISYISKPFLDNSGNFVYKISASDIDDDKLSYSLIDPEDGMIVDQYTGVISWDLTKVKKNKPEVHENTEKTEDPLSLVRIKFKVIDSDGAEAAGTILFNAKTGSEVDY